MTLVRLLRRLDLHRNDHFREYSLDSVLTIRASLPEPTDEYHEEIDSIISRINPDHFDYSLQNNAIVISQAERS